MADKQVEIEVVAKSDLTEIEELSDMVEHIKEEAGEETTINLYMDDLKAELEEATTEAEGLREQLMDMEVGDPDFGNLLADLEEAESKVDDLTNQLDAINNLTVSPNMDGMNSQMEETASTADSLTTAIAGIGATAGIEEMVSTADRINTSWNRLQLTFEGTGVSMDELREKATIAGQLTGRSGGLIRDYFNQMGIAGVTNTDLLTSSFEALSGKAYQTGNSIESMETKMQTMAMTGNASGKMLKNLGITAEDLATAMGVSADEVSDAFKDLTPEERIAAITDAMGHGTEANEMYKDSYAGLKDRADAAMAGLMGAVGQAILPVVVPALEAATNFIKMLTDGFNSLPGPVKTAIGVIGGIVAIATAIIGVVGVVGQVLAGVGAGLEALGIAGGLTGIISGLGSAFSGLFAILIANPIILVVAAIALLIAGLVWAYYNVDWFREMVDNAWASLVQFGQQIYGAVADAIQWLGSLFQNFTNQLGLNTNDWIQAVLGFILFLPTLPLQIGIALTNAIAKALGFKGNFVQTLWNTATDAVSKFANAINGIVTAVQSCLDWAYQVFMSHPIVQAAVWLGQAIANGFSALGLGQHSPGKIVQSMNQELDWTQEAIERSKLPSSAASLGSDLANSFNPNFETGNINSVSGGGVAGNITINLEIGSVDNDERVNEIVDAVRRALSWDNRTAGRTV